MLEHEPGLKRAGVETTIKKVREAGVATIPSEVVDGVTDLSAPIIEGNHAVCALTVPFIERRGAKIDMKATAHLLATAAGDISRELSHGAP
jgi:DNA-binding IclR family transcriptional regulator